jgi:hypothetical protein
MPTARALDAMRTKKQPLPAAVTVSAMIDTGAGVSVIRTGVPQQLNLQPVGIQSINTPTSYSVLCHRYSIRMVFPFTGGIKVPVSIDMVMTETPLKGQNIQCLLGRDFLQHGVLIYSGPDETFTFSF